MLEVVKDQVDWRLPEHREQVFLDFYEFHLKYRAHPGAVYYLMPYLRQINNMTEEEALWFAFINGNTQNPITSWILWGQFPTPDHADEMLEWFEENYLQLSFDTDRRYHKKNFPNATKGYLKLLSGRTQGQMWHEAALGGFDGVWKIATAIPSFGRLSAFSYGEYLRIMGIDYDCDNLLLSDISGSRSHRNGLCIVTGLDEYDWHKSNPNFEGNYPAALISALEDVGSSLLQKAKARAVGTDFEKDVSYFTLESALCTYKSWHRPNRRYPNVYNDMLYYRIKKAEKDWQNLDFSVFWEARKQYLPDYLRLEDNPHDVGLVPLKQNHYLKTGQVIMMDRDYTSYQNSYNDAVRAGTLPRREDNDD